MLTWEFPPMIAGGLAMASYGLVTSLLKAGVEIDLFLPTKEFVYFPLRCEADADTLPFIMLDDNFQPRKEEFVTTEFKTIEEKMEYLGVTHVPETYYTPALAREFTKMISSFHTSKFEHRSEQSIFENISINLQGEEDIFKKVQEMAYRAEKLSELIDFDIIHANDWLCYPAGMIVKKMTGKPLIAHIHATEFDRAGGPGDDRIHKIEYSGMLYADQVIAVSKYTAQMVISRYQIDTGKVNIVHNAFSFEKGNCLYKEKMFKGPTVLFLGRITVQKGPDYFLSVAERILKKYPQVRFIMAGTGDMARKILRTSASMKLKNKFLFAGFLNRKQVERILRVSDIYMLPSVSEPFGIAPLEAMAYGITSIISKQSGVSEVVEHAYKIDFWNVDEMVKTLSYLIEHPEECKEVGELGAEEVKAIQWDKSAEKVKNIYQEILDSNRGEIDA
jgi:glycosyltransferase involved in cell wall biosynthesis